MGREGYKVFVRLFLPPSVRAPAGPEKNRNEFFKKSLEFLRETGIEGNRFFSPAGEGAPIARRPIRGHEKNRQY